MRHRLSGLEAGRFVAALLVACMHFSIAFENLRGVRIYDMAFRAGHAGVEYFFVLSGFIIFLVHRPDIGAPERLKPFLVKRFVRLYPLFWLVSLVLLAVFLAPTAVSGHRSLSGGGLILDFLLLPTAAATLVDQSWSLRHEIVFYAIFALAIWNARVGVVALVAWQVAALVVGLIVPETLPSALKPFFYLYNVGFGVGIATGWATQRWAVRYGGAVAAAGLVAFVSLMTLEWAVGRDIPVPALPLGGVASPLLYIGAAAAIIFGATQMERRRPLPAQRLLGVLGGSSYALYLIHTMVGSIVIRLFGIWILARTPNVVVFVAMVGASVLAAVVLHLWVEKPLLAALRTWLLSSPRVPADVVSGPAALVTPRIDAPAGAAWAPVESRRRPAPPNAA